MTEGQGVTGKAAPEDDVNALVQMVLRRSYLEATEDLRDYAEKVRTFNSQKMALRDKCSGQSTVLALLSQAPC